MNNFTTMNARSLYKKWCDIIISPYKGNIIFFIFSYIVVISESIIEYFDYKPKYYEAFIDLYLLCFIINLFKTKIRKWIKLFIMIGIYFMAFSQTFCYINFGVIITPTIIQIVSETNLDETSNFFQTYLNSEILSSKILILFCILLTHIIVIIVSHRPTHITNLSIRKEIIALFTFFVICLGSYTYINNKYHFLTLTSQNDISDVERKRNDTFGDGMYAPIYNLIYSIRANTLAYKQIYRIYSITKSIKTEKCDFTSPNIILIIGESYNKHHSQLYGYTKKTTPNQCRRLEKGELFPFTNVVSPWNITSNAFRNIFSLYSYGD